MEGINVNVKTKDYIIVSQDFLALNEVYEAETDPTTFEVNYENFNRMPMVGEVCTVVWENIITDHSFLCIAKCNSIGEEFINLGIGSYVDTTGATGPTGTNATITGATASVTNSTGTPSVRVTSGGTDSERIFNFEFSNLKGDKGNNGANGTNGVGVSTAVVTYQSSTSGTVIPPDFVWSSSIPYVSPGSYLWTRTKTTYTDDTSTTVYSVARQGEKGATGPSGKDGQGVYSTNVEGGDLILYTQDVDGSIFEISSDGYLKINF